MSTTVTTNGDASALFRSAVASTGITISGLGEIAALEAAVANQIQAPVVTSAAAAQATGILQIGNATQDTVGSAGAASAIPASPTHYLKVYIGSTLYVIPLFVAA